MIFEKHCINNSFPCVTRAWISDTHSTPKVGSMIESSIEHLISDPNEGQRVNGTETKRRDIGGPRDNIKMHWKKNKNIYKKRGIGTYINCCRTISQLLHPINNVHEF